MGTHTEQSEEKSNKRQYSQKIKINKVVRLGTYENMNVFCKIEYKDGKLSISGVEGPMRNGDCKGSCGQIDMHLRSEQHKIQHAPHWDAAKTAEFFAIWKRWHLNDLKAGSPVQEEWLRNNPMPKEEYAYPKSHYEVASQKLADAGLNPDQDGYMYGHAWKTEQVPLHVLEFLESLPDTDVQPAWV
jgi:hypothetical protein